MAHTSKEWSKKPTTSSEKTCNGSEYHLDIGENNGQLIAGNYNNITTYNFYNLLMTDSPRKDSNNSKERSQKRLKKKTKRRQKSVESDGCQRSRKNSESVKGKNSAKNSPRKERESNEYKFIEEKSKYQDDRHAEDDLKDQDFVTTSEDDESAESYGHLCTTRDDEDKKTSTPRNRRRNKENISKKGNFAIIPENESESTCQVGQSGDLFSPLKVALRQATCFTACSIFCFYFEVLSFLPFMFLLIFVANNLLASFSCIKLTFKTINCRDMPPLERPFIAIARLQVDFFIKEENILQRLFASLLCVSLAFVSSQVFGCETCLVMQTVVVTIISTIPYLLFKNNSLLPFPLAEHCRVFKAGIHSSGNIVD